MEKLNDVYRCNKCGNIVEMVHVGGGELVCCGEPMKLLTPKIEDEGYEKHVPVIYVLSEVEGEKTDTGVTVKVGSVPHPMIDEHYIEWIEVLTNEKVYRKYLKPGMEPEVSFNIKEEPIWARIYCNIHSLWKSK